MVKGGGKTFSRGRGGRGKRISSEDDVIARNNAVSDDEEEEEGGKGAGKGYPTKEKKEKKEEPGESGDDEPKEGEKEKKKKPVIGLGGVEVSNPNAKKHDELSGEISRKQREEMEKTAATRRYQELHKAGKTDEAKADLARLEEVKARRAAATAKRQEEEAATKAAEEERLVKKGGMTKEVKEALGGDAARLRGERSKMANQTAPRVKNDVNLYSYVDGAGEKVKKPEEGVDFHKADGSINSCRAAEDDFM